MNNFICLMYFLCIFEQKLSISFGEILFVETCPVSGWRGGQCFPLLALSDLFGLIWEMFLLLLCLGMSMEEPFPEEKLGLVVETTKYEVGELSQAQMGFLCTGSVRHHCGKDWEPQDKCVGFHFVCESPSSPMCSGTLLTGVLWPHWYSLTPRAEFHGSFRFAEKTILT